ncbi:MAG: hypothetical protein ACPKM0_02980 [Pleomorphochaeta sp.]
MDNYFKNKSIALFFGGRSPEHEVSINSSKTIYPILEKLFKNVFLIYVSKIGNYYLINCDKDFKIDKNFKITDIIKVKNEITFAPNKGILLNNNLLEISLAFILIHGNEGEDGKLQGLLDIVNIKYTGVNSTSSGICIYKELARQILNSNNINTVDTVVIKKSDIIPDLEKIQKRLNKSLFIKSETTGSSIGITALKNPSNQTFLKAIKHSFKYSNRVLIQPLLEDIKEIEVAILEKRDHSLIAGGPGLVIKSNMKDILSYDKKYGEIDSATINTEVIKDNNFKLEMKREAIKIFKLLNLSGFSRIDFFLYKNKIILNEINTIPGLTSKSHYPILIKSENISLIDAIYEICRVAYDK